jgi:hypothetical protein
LYGTLSHYNGENPPFFLNEMARSSPALFEEKMPFDQGV